MSFTCNVVLNWQKGGLATRTNPMVGAVLVHNDRIIGEGWHTPTMEALMQK